MITVETQIHTNLEKYNSSVSTNTSINDKRERAFYSSTKNQVPTSLLFRSVAIIYTKLFTIL